MASWRVAETMIRVAPTRTTKATQPAQRTARAMADSRSTACSP
jgi:hypothetical protein